MKANSFARKLKRKQDNVKMELIQKMSKLNDEQLHVIARLREVSKELREKAENAEYEANDMSRDAGEFEELADALQSGDMEGAMYIAESPSYDKYDICHIDMYDLEDANDFIENIEDTIRDVFEVEEEEDEDE